MFKKIRFKFILISLAIVFIFVLTGFGFYFFSTELLERERGKSRNSFTGSLLEIVSENAQKEIEQIRDKTLDLVKALGNTNDKEIVKWMVDTFFKTSCLECFNLAIFARELNSYVLKGKYYNSRVDGSAEFSSFLKKNNKLSSKELNQAFKTEKIIINVFNARFPRENGQMGNALFRGVFKISQSGKRNDIIVAIDFDGENIVSVLNRTKISSGFISIVDESRRPVVMFNGENGSTLIGKETISGDFSNKGIFLPIKNTEFAVGFFEGEKSYLTETEKSLLAIISFIITILLVLAFIALLFAIRRYKKKGELTVQKQKGKVGPLSSPTSNKKIVSPSNNSRLIHKKNVSEDVRNRIANTKTVATPPLVKKSVPVRPSPSQNPSLLKQNFIKKPPEVGAKKPPPLKKNDLINKPPSLPKENLKKDEKNLPPGIDFFNSFHRDSTDTETVIEFDENISLLNTEVLENVGEKKNPDDDSMPSNNEDEYKINLDDIRTENIEDENDFERLKATDSIEKETFGIVDRHFDETDVNMNDKKYEPWEQEYSIDRTSGTRKENTAEGDKKTDKKNSLESEMPSFKKENDGEKNIKEVHKKTANQAVGRLKVNTEKQQDDAINDNIVVPRPKLKSEDE